MVRGGASPAARQRCRVRPSIPSCLQSSKGERNGRNRVPALSISDGGRRAILRPLRSRFFDRAMPDHNLSGARQVSGDVARCSPDVAQWRRGMMLTGLRMAKNLGFLRLSWPFSGATDKQSAGVFCLERGAAARRLESAAPPR